MPTVCDSTGTGGGGPATSGASSTSDSAPASAVSGAGCSAGAQRSELVQGRLIQKPSTASNRSRSEEHTSELQSLMRISYAVFCLKKKKPTNYIVQTTKTT